MTFQRFTTVISVCLSVGWTASVTAASPVVPAKEITQYADRRPATRYRLEAKDHGVVFRHGQGPGQCDTLGARDVWVWQHTGTYYMHKIGLRTCRVDETPG